MDALLLQCFLQAAHRLSDKQLPMPINTFYSAHMRPRRPAGSSLEVSRRAATLHPSANPQQGASPRPTAPPQPSPAKQPTPSAPLHALCPVSAPLHPLHLCTPSAQSLHLCTLCR